MSKNLSKRIAVVLLTVAAVLLTAAATGSAAVSGPIIIIKSFSSIKK